MTKTGGEEEDLGEEKMCYKGERDSYMGKAVIETELWLEGLFAFFLSCFLTIFLLPPTQPQLSPFQSSPQARERATPLRRKIRQKRKPQASKRAPIQ